MSSPGIADEIVEGEYLNIVCDRCGKVLKPEFELNFRSSLQHIALKFLPEIAREGSTRVISTREKFGSW